MVENSSFETQEFLNLLRKSAQMDNVTRIVTPIIIFCLLTVGLIGNVLVIYVSVTTKRIIKHPLHSILVLNLAISDVIYLLASAPFHATASSTPRWIYGSFMCPLLHFFSVLTTAVSIYTMLSLASIRFLALMMPFTINKSMISTAGNRSGCLLICIVWMIGAILASPAAYYFQIVSIEESIEMVECIWKEESGYDAYNIALFVVVFLFPLLSVMVIYSFILGILHRMQMRQVEGPYSGSQEKAEYLKSTRLIFFLVVGFIVCWFPFYLFKLLWIHKDGEDYLVLSLMILETVGLCASYAHACINPIIYTFAAPGFRQSIGMFCKRHFSLNRLYDSINQKRKSGQILLKHRDRYSDQTSRILVGVDQAQISNLVTNVNYSQNRKKSQDPRVAVQTSDK